MTKWEYCFVDELYKSDIWDDLPEETLVRYLADDSLDRQQSEGIDYTGYINIDTAATALGQVGWEMCGIYPKTHMPNRAYRLVRYFFKRPIEG